MTAADFLTLWGWNSAQAAVLVLVILGLQRLLRTRLTPAWRCGLWLLVVARLALPVSLPSRLSLFNCMPVSEKRAAVPRGLLPPGPPDRFPQKPISSNAPNPSSPASSAETEGASKRPRPVTPESTRDSRSPVRLPSTPKPARLVALVDRVRSESEDADPWGVVLWGWLGVVCLFGAAILRNSWSFWRRVRFLKPLEDDSLVGLWTACCHRLHVGRPPPVYEMADLPSPALYGCVRARLLLPANFASRFSLAELRYILLHEASHIKRADLFWNWLATVLQILHWFNPILWFGFARWRADRELACDALAMEAAGDGSQRGYGETILRLLDGDGPGYSGPALVGILEDKAQLRRRLEMIGMFRPGWRPGWVVVLPVLLLCVMGLTDAQRPAPVAAAAASPVQAATPAREVRVGADPLPADGSATRSLKIRVRDKQSGRPIAGAELLCGAADLPWAAHKEIPKRLTDPEGSFVLQLPLPDAAAQKGSVEIFVDAMHPDYAQHAIAWTASSGGIYDGLPQEADIRLEKGQPIGGEVRDARGHPLPGIRVELSGSGYRGYTENTGERLFHDYPDLWRRNFESPITTDAAGRWRFEHCPEGIDNVVVGFVRPDGVSEEFSTQGGDMIEVRPLIAWGELRQQRAVSVLDDGFTLRGRVVDGHGDPIPGATVREGYGHGNVHLTTPMTSGADGRFSIDHRHARQWIYTASAEGYASASLVVDVKADLQEFQLVLPPEKPLKIQVVNESGNPVPGASLSVAWAESGWQTIEWKASTDAQGLAIWRQRPLAPVVLSAQKSLRFRTFEAGPNETEQRVVLGPLPTDKITIHGKAIDSESGTPVPLRNVGFRNRGNGSPYNRLADSPGAEFTVEINAADLRTLLYYEIRVEADGYQSQLSRKVSFAEGDQFLTFRMRAASKAERLVTLPSGKPAAGAWYWYREPTGEWGRVTETWSGERLPPNQSSDKGGRVTLPAVPGETVLLIAHHEGFLETTVGEALQAKELRLQAYGNVQGRLFMEGKPVPRRAVHLALLVNDPYRLFQPFWEVETNEKGAFEFTRIPPGEHKLYLTEPSINGIPYTEICRMPVTVKPGETSQVDYRFRGRRVIGHIETVPRGVSPQSMDVEQYLELVVPQGPSLHRDDFASFDAYLRADREAMRSAEIVAREKARRAYPLTRSADGEVQAVDVPPGTYDLVVRITRHEPDRMKHHFLSPWDHGIGWLKTQVIIPEGEGTFDMGRHEVPVRASELLKAPAVPDLVAKALDGQRFHMADLQGHYVVLVFWASWSRERPDDMSRLVTILQSYALVGRVRIVFANVDDQFETAQSAAAQRGYPGRQVWILAQGRAQAAAALGVTELPSISVINPLGGVIETKLSIGSLDSFLKRVLPPP